MLSMSASVENETSRQPSKRAGFDLEWVWVRIVEVEDQAEGALTMVTKPTILLEPFETLCPYATPSLSLQPIFMGICPSKPRYLVPPAKCMETRLQNRLCDSLNVKIRTWHTIGVNLIEDGQCKCVAVDV